MSLLRLLPLPAALALGTAPALQAGLYQVTVTVSNPAPADGTMITPVWVGFHDGMFDHFDVGGAASAAIQRIAEDGNVTPLAEAFNASGHGGASGVILGLNPAPPVFRPGDTNQMSFAATGDWSMATWADERFVYVLNGRGDPAGMRFRPARG